MRAIRPRCHLGLGLHHLTASLPHCHWLNRGVRDQTLTSTDGDDWVAGGGDWRHTFGNTEELPNGTHGVTASADTPSSCKAPGVPNEGGRRR